MHRPKFMTLVTWVIICLEVFAIKLACPKNCCCVQQWETALVQHDRDGCCISVSHASRAAHVPHRPELLQATR